AGSIDPEILLYVLRHGLAPAEELERALEHESGLLALGGTTRVEELERREDADARLALEVFCHRVAGAVATTAAALGGLDALVFTAGIGEGSAQVRERVCSRLGFLGVGLDAEANRAARPDADVAAAGSPARVWVVHAREDVVAARAARALL
ncbi:MAG TPA: hypothetical protein VLB47_00445, partial [Solirubrobacteraceae bacterium]|nr:hypothetical protein [Solirubrobacteraceae bacterium]